MKGQGKANKDKGEDYRGRGKGEKGRKRGEMSGIKLEILDGKK